MKLRTTKNVLLSHTAESRGIQNYIKSNNFQIVNTIKTLISRYVQSILYNRKNKSKFVLCLYMICIKYI